MFGQEKFVPIQARNKSVAASCDHGMEKIDWMYIYIFDGTKMCHDDLYHDIKQNH